jgi:TonB family protein
MRYMAAYVVAFGLMSGVSAAQSFEPAQLTDGQLVVPALPGPTVIGWGEVFLEATVSIEGRVTGLRELRTVAPFGALLRQAVERWEFQPAGDGEETVASRVLVAALYRPRVLHNTPTAGSPPRDVAAASTDIPEPIATSTPLHPPRAIGDAVVVIEAHVGADGAVGDARVLTAASGFDDSALEAARQWRFRPARHDDAPAEAYAYLVFAFREPVGF